jgi:hypothetical protein
MARWFSARESISAESNANAGRIRPIQPILCGARLSIFFVVRHEKPVVAL